MKDTPKCLFGLGLNDQLEVLDYLATKADTEIKIALLAKLTSKNSFKKIAAEMPVDLLDNMMKRMNEVYDDISSLRSEQQTKLKVFKDEALSLAKQMQASGFVVTVDELLARNQAYQDALSGKVSVVAVARRPQMIFLHNVDSNDYWYSGSGRVPRWAGNLTSDELKATRTGDIWDDGSTYKIEPKQATLSSVAIRAYLISPTKTDVSKPNTKY